MNAGRDVQAALAIRDGWIVAVSDDRDGLDALAAESTQVVDDPDLTLLPAFFDIHEHLLDSARNLATPEGEWIQTSNGWNESNLTDGRLPTAAELDRASTEHPILAPRGGRVSVTNTRGLELMGVTSTTPDPPGAGSGAFPTGRRTTSSKAARHRPSRRSFRHRR
jgi:predicted amidohydrolase YtcJ